MPNFQPTRLVLVWNQFGAFQGASVEGLLEGTTNPTQPLALTDIATNPIVTEILGDNAANLAQVEALQLQVASLSPLQAQVSALQAENAALQEQLDLLQNPVAPAGNWATFRAAIAQSAAYLRIAGFSGETSVLASQMIWAIGAGALQEVPALWNSIATKASPTTAEISELNGLATAAGVAFSLDAQGRMTV